VEGWIFLKPYLPLALGYVLCELWYSRIIWNFNWI